MEMCHFKRLQPLILTITPLPHVFCLGDKDLNVIGASLQLTSSLLVRLNAAAGVSNNALMSKPKSFSKRMPGADLTSFKCLFKYCKYGYTSYI